MITPDSAQQPLSLFNTMTFNAACTKRDNYWHVKYKVAHPRFTHSGPAIIDTGSENTIIPFRNVNSDVVKRLEKPRSVSIHGIGGKVPVLGICHADLQLGELVLPNVLLMVVDQPIPALLGQNITRHPSISKFEADERDKVIRMEKRNGDKTQFDFTDHATAVPESTVFKAESEANLSLEEKLHKLKSSWNIDLDHPDPTELEGIADLVLKYGPDVFGDEDNMGLLVGCQAELRTEGLSIGVPARKMNPTMQKRVQEEIDRMKAMGVIEKCPDNKGWNSPIQPVEKDDGRIRVCVDFSRTVNRRLVQIEPYAQPSVEEILNSIPPSSKYFTNVDLLAGYWQVEIAECDRFKTAFWWGEENFQFRRLPMGLKSSGNIFSREVARILGGAKLDSNIYKYLDDICIITDDYQAHIKSLENLFKCLIRAGAKLKPSKCNFLATNKGIKFLGRKVSSKGVEPDSDYITGVQNLQAPRTKKELEKLCGNLVWVKSFLGARLGEEVAKINFSSLMSPIFEVKRQPTFEWTKQAQKALDRVKTRLSSCPVIGYADFKLPFMLVTDASKVAAAGVLMQQQGEKLVIIGHCSKLFNSTERNWSTLERELFAIVYSIRSFKYFLQGHSFIIKTDHRPLIYVDRTNFKSSSKVSGWQRELAEYDFVVEHVKGTSNIFADWLSRPFVDHIKEEIGEAKVAGKICAVENSKLVVYIPSWCVPPSSTGQVSGIMKFNSQLDNYGFFNGPEDRITQGFACFMSKQEIDQKSPTLVKYLPIADAQLEDFACGKIIQILESYGEKSKPDQIRELATKDSDYLQALVKHAEKFELDYGSRLLLIRTESLKVVVPPSKIPSILRQAHSSAHLGAERTLQMLSNFWWPGQKKDVEIYVRSCQNCAQKKGRYSLQKPMSGALNKGTREFQIIYVDYIQVPNVRGYKYCMTLMDGFSRWIEIYPSKTNTARDTVRFLEKFILKFGRVPDELSSDRGTHFTSSTVEKWCKELGIVQRLHCAYRPQSSGNIERSHRTIKNSLFCAAFENGNTWLDNVDLVRSILNGCKNKATEKSPFEVIYGRPYEMMRLPVPSSVSESSTKNAELSVAARKMKCRDAIIKLQIAADQQALDKANKKFDYTELLPGTSVLIFRPESARAKATKMSWVGPYTVIKSNQLTAKLHEPETGKEDWVSRHHIRPITPRPAHLEESDSEDELDSVPSEGGVPTPISVKVENDTEQARKKRVRSPNILRKPEPTAPAKKVKVAPPPTVTAPTSDPASSPTAPLRRSGRHRKPPDKMNLDPKLKSYR